MKWLMHGKASAESSYTDLLTTLITALLYKQTRFCLSIIPNDSTTGAVV